MFELIQRVSENVTSAPLRLVVGARCTLMSRLRGERGQTSSEYLLIAGVAVVIIIAVMAIFSEQLSEGAESIMENITGEID